MDSKLRVLIVRLGAMGDILHALPAVTALRAAHSEWVLGWAVEPRWKALLQSSSGEMPLVDRLHLVPAKEWGRRPLAIKTLRGIRDCRRGLRETRYDVCVDLQGAVRSAMVARWAHPNRMIGEDRPREPAARFLFSERVPTIGVHVIEQAIEVLQAVAKEALPVLPPLLPHDPLAEEWCDRLVTQRPGLPCVLINPGAGWGAKRWPAARYGEVARELAALGFAVVVNAGPDEMELATEMVAASGGKALPAAPSLGQLIELTRRAALVIAGDTGPLHLACALGKPVVGIFGPTDPARNGPFGCDFKVLRHPESRRDHTRRAEPEAGLLTIQPEAVVSAARELLSSVQQHRGMANG